MKFYNRGDELKLLKGISRNYRIAVVGRRRVGKTRLVEHFYKNKCLTFFVPAEKAEKEIISDWAREYSELHLPSVGTFKEFFDSVFFHYRNKVIFIDEMQNILRVNKSFLFDLQRLMDKHKTSKVVVTGSLISVMKKIIEEYKSPLYGRFDLIIKLKELDFKTIYQICRDLRLGIEEAFVLYSIFGGIPKHYELIEKLRAFEPKKAITVFFIDYPRPLYEEVRTMLKEEFGKEYKTFFSILSAISRGKNRHSDISGYIGRKQTEITKYLAMLRDDFELIERKLPAAGGKRGIYSIKNNLVCFWFSNIWKYAELIETGQEKQVSETVRNNINKYIAQKFEKTIFELISSKQVMLPIDFKKLGSQWGKIPREFKPEKGRNTYEIDIVALNKKNKQVLFAECKWKNKVNALKIVKELVEKSKFVQWHNEERKEYFAVFAKTFSKKIKEFEGKPVKCFDLKEIERALKK